MSDQNKEIKISKVVVDRNLCIGAASCVAVAPSVFELNGENKAVMLRKDGTKNSGPVNKADMADQQITDDILLLAAKSCPTNAIFVYDEQGNQIYP